MSISWMDRPEVPKLPRNLSYGTSNIFSLNLEPGFQMLEVVLNEILGYPRKLKSLVTNLPGRDLSIHSMSGQELTTHLSPVAIPRALDPTKHSLVELRLVDENCVWPSHDRSRTDLSEFTALRKLQISPLCYFLLPRPPKRDGIVHLSPTSLEEIEVCNLHTQLIDVH
jgi:hypothetical protein